MTTDEQKFGRADEQAARWRRVVIHLDDKLPGWRKKHCFLPGVPDEQFIGDAACNAISTAADAEARSKTITQQGDKIRALEAELQRMREQVQRSEAERKELVTTNGLQADKIQLLRDKVTRLTDELQGERSRGVVTAEFRLKADKRWDGSYTKRVVDAVKATDWWQRCEARVRERGGLSVDSKGFNVFSTVGKALELLEDYHSTMHHVYQRAETAERQLDNARRGLETQAFAMAQLLADKYRTLNQQQMNTAMNTAMNQAASRYVCSPCQGFEKQQTSDDCHSASLRIPVRDPYPQWTAAIQNTGRAGDELERAVGGGSNPTFSAVFRPALAKYIRAIIAEVKERDKAYPNKA